MTKKNSLDGDPKALVVNCTNGQTISQATARTALKPAFNSGLVIDAYQTNIVGKDVQTQELILGLSASMVKVNDGDLAELEAMLVGQATALQTIFTSLARRAAHQEYQKNYEAFLGLALKAQAQSRATIQAVVDLKFPRQATFVKQANITNGPQQVNNGVPIAPHAGENGVTQNKLLEAGHGQPSSRMDTGTAQKAKRGDPAVATLGKIDRAKQPRR